MRFVSTRDGKDSVSFKQALLDCMPADGGLYVPDGSDDLRRWILYTNDKTSFANIAGTLTSALINTEFSPIICETIATRAFPFEPVLKKLDDNLFVLELFHGPTGSLKDFGTSYLTSCLESMMQLDGGRSILLDASITGELGACLAHALRGKKLLKSALLVPKGKLRGMEESDFVWNGGNIYPIEVDGTAQDCHNLVRKIFSDRSLVEQYHLTVANSANIGRLLPQAFFYTYAFSRLKEQVSGDIYYALTAGNYGNLISGLYGWHLALPVNGFICPTTDNLQLDIQGRCTVLDSLVPFKQRSPADPSDPSNLERLEYLFRDYAPMMKSFVFPAKVSMEQKEAACKTLFMKYHYLANESTSAAYAAALQKSEMTEADDGTVVLIMRHDPSHSASFIRRSVGETPVVPANTAAALKPVTLNKPVIAANDIEHVISVLNSLNLLRIF
jgi:threonine synthase